MKEELLDKWAHKLVGVTGLGECPTTRKTRMNVDGVVKKRLIIIDFE